MNGAGASLDRATIAHINNLIRRALRGDPRARMDLWRLLTHGPERELPVPVMARRGIGAESDRELPPPFMPRRDYESESTLEIPPERALGMGGTSRPVMEIPKYPTPFPTPRRPMSTPEFRPTPTGVATPFPTPLPRFTEPPTPPRFPARFPSARPEAGATPSPFFGTSVVNTGGGTGGGVRPELVKAVMGRESGGRIGAVGAKGEIGAFQVMPSTAAMYGISPEALRSPEVNRWVAERYLSDLLKRYNGDERRALMAYNAGPHRVDTGRIPKAAVFYADDVLQRAAGTPPIEFMTGRAR